MTTNEEIYQICIEIKQEIATINERCVSRGKDIQGIKRTVYGTDGSGGVVAKAEKNKSRLDAINGVNAIRLSWQQKILAPVLTAIIIATIFTSLIILALHFNYL